MQLIDYLLASGMAPDERSARGIIMRGDALVNERPQSSPHFEIEEGDAVRVRGEVSHSVTRGQLKIAPVMERIGFEVNGRICLDLGVSTGGFTQALLERGAARVYAVDVAYGITAVELRSDPRVVLLERTNARELTPAHVPEAVARVVGDLSFISWSSVVPAIVPLLAPQAELLLLVKPQFELAAQGRSAELAAGIASSALQWRDSLLALFETWQRHQLTALAIVPAALRGARGNQEFFAYLRYADAGVSLEQYTNMVDAAIEECAP
jgi:23S rRNA (cytidine1920-2'-O)/16S rRNA (cytidine1409-2'-O)-methyltransferase